MLWKARSFLIIFLLLLLFSRSVVPDSLQPCGLQYTRLPCLSPSPRVCSKSCPLSQWCRPTISSPVTPFSSCPQSFLASVSFPVSQLFTIRWPKFWSFSFSISPSNEYSGFISFRMDWFNLLAVQGTLKSLLQHHSSEVWVLSSSAFFMVQLSQPYTTTGKTIALTAWTSIGNVMFLLFNTLSKSATKWTLSWLGLGYALHCPTETSTVPSSLSPWSEPRASPLALPVLSDWLYHQALRHLAITLLAEFMSQKSSLALLSFRGHCPLLSSCLSWT